MSTELLRMSDFTPTTPVVIDTTNGHMSLCVNDVLKWLCPEAPPSQALRLLMVCKGARVNPFEGEAYLVKYGDKWTIVFDKSGWLHRAEDHPMFDGFQFGIIVRKFDETTKKPTGDAIDLEGTFLPHDYILVGGWSKIYRKDRKFPTVSRISLSEYRQKSPTWDRITCTMAAKVALIQALRHSGVVFAWRGYDRDEMPVPAGLPMRPDPGPVSKAIETEFSFSPMPTLSPHLMVELKDAIIALEMTDEQVDKMLLKRNVTALADLTDFQAQDILLKLKAKLDQRNAGDIMLPDPTPAVAQTEIIDGQVVINGEIVGETSQESGFDSIPQDVKDRMIATRRVWPPEVVPVIMPVPTDEQLAEIVADKDSRVDSDMELAKQIIGVQQMPTQDQIDVAEERSSAIAEEAHSSVELDELSEDFPNAVRPEGSPKKPRKKKEQAS